MIGTVRGAVLACAALAAMPAFAQGAPRCTRADLQKVADGYVAAVAAGDSTKLPMNLWMRYSENGDDSVSINGGLFAEPKKVDYHHDLLDTAACQVYVELVITDPKHPYVVGTRIAVGGGYASEAEATVTDAGDWLFNAGNTLKYASAETWGPLPAGRREDRAAIKAAADAYLDYFADKKVAVPWGTPCARLEGGLYTAKGQSTDSCNVGVPDNIAITNRRYVIDEDQGAVAVLNSFGPSKRPDVHTFRVEGGKLRYIHTITVCDKPNCGLPLPASIGGPAAAAGG